MIQATRDLLQYLTRNSWQRDSQIVQAYSNTILVFGGPEDGNALIDFFIENPSDYYSYYVYQIMGNLGTEKGAEKLFEAAIENDKVIDAFEPDVLEVLGNLKYAPAKPALVEYSLGDHGYYPNLYAVWGLLNFDCSGIEDEIQMSIETVYGKNIFNEYLPALVCKLSDREEVLEKLFTSGTEYCSTDCNAGIVLGFSLCGDEGLPYFRKALYHPAWEAYGPPFVTFIRGMKNLGITFSELYHEVRNMENTEEQAYSTKVLAVLLEEAVKMDSPLVQGKESWKSLQQNLFGWKNSMERDNFEDLAKKYGWEDLARKAEEFLYFRIREEILLENSNS